MKMPNRTGCRIDLWGTLLATGLQVGVVPLITTLDRSCSADFQLNEDLTEEGVKELSALQVDNIHSFSVIHQTSLLSSGSSMICP